MDSLGTSPRAKTKPLALVAIIALIILVVVVDMKRRGAEKQLEQLSVRLEQLTGNEQQNREAAQRIVDRVRQLYDIPTDVEPTVATIVDVTELQKRNAFYNKAKNGDYLIVTSDRAILFDAQRNVILDVVPVQIQPAAAAAEADAQQ